MLSGDGVTDGMGTTTGKHNGRDYSFSLCAIPGAFQALVAQRCLKRRSYANLSRDAYNLHHWVPPETVSYVPTGLRWVTDLNFLSSNDREAETFTTTLPTNF